MKEMTKKVKTHLLILITLSSLLLLVFLCGDHSSLAQQPIAQQPSNYPYNDDTLIGLITQRIEDIRQRISNPATPKGERERLEQELTAMTNMLSRILTRSTNPNPSTQK